MHRGVIASCNGRRSCDKTAAEPGDRTSDGSTESSLIDTSRLPEKGPRMKSGPDASNTISAEKLGVLRQGIYRRGSTTIASDHQLEGVVPLRQKQPRMARVPGAEGRGRRFASGRRADFRRASCQLAMIKSQTR